jgi:CBS domain-containing protein
LASIRADEFPEDSSYSHRPFPLISVEEIMAADPQYVSPETTITECMAMMTDKHIRHLPVLGGDDLVGLVSMGDVVKLIISECQAKVGDLEVSFTVPDPESHDLRVS